MSKHTPGPWYHDFASGMKNGNAALIEYFVRRDGDSVSIAADIVDPDTCNLSEANARLIAAAPTMLDALKKIDSLRGPFMTAQQVSEVWKTVDAAIAKATRIDQ